MFEGRCCHYMRVYYYVICNDSSACIGQNKRENWVGKQSLLYPFVLKLPIETLSSQHLVRCSLRLYLLTFNNILPSIR